MRYSSAIFSLSVAFLHAQSSFAQYRESLSSISSQVKYLTFTQLASPLTKFTQRTTPMALQTRKLWQICYRQALERLSERTSRSSGMLCSTMLLLTSSPSWRRSRQRREILRSYLVRSFCRAIWNLVVLIAACSDRIMGAIDLATANVSTGTPTLADVNVLSSRVCTLCAMFVNSILKRPDFLGNACSRPSRFTLHPRRETAKHQPSRELLDSEFINFRS